MNVDKLKALVKKEAEHNGVDHQSVYDTFFFECFLRKLSLSAYRNCFVLKGGFLLESILGISMRTTMDIDFKAEGISLEEKELLQMMKKVCSISSDDGVGFRVIGISDIKAETKYGGKTIKIEARLQNLRKIFSIDVAEGDLITPYPENYEFHSRFGLKSFQIFAYNNETMLAEKFETLISRGTTNSRSKDLFDIHILMNENLDKTRLSAALINTFHQRGIELNKSKIKQTLDSILYSSFRKELYESYAEKHPFAQFNSFKEVLNSSFKVLDIIEENEKILPDSTTSITLVRHGEDDRYRVGGFSESCLTKNGILQMKTLAEKLDYDYDLIISSDLFRAKESAQILSDKLSCPILYEKGLREVDNGDYSLLSTEEFAKGKYKRFIDLDMDENYPHGESPTSFFMRIKETYIRILTQYKGKRILVVTHAGVMTAIICLSHGYKFSNLLRLSPSYGSKIVIK